MVTCLGILHALPSTKLSILFLILITTLQQSKFYCIHFQMTKVRFKEVKQLAQGCKQQAGTNVGKETIRSYSVKKPAIKLHPCRSEPH